MDPCIEKDCLYYGGYAWDCMLSLGFAPYHRTCKARFRAGSWQNGWLMYLWLLRSGGRGGGVLSPVVIESVPVLDLLIGKGF